MKETSEKWEDSPLGEDLTASLLRVTPARHSYLTLLFDTPAKTPAMKFFLKTITKLKHTTIGYEAQNFLIRSLMNWTS